jgi:site-specific DNA-methyltransferase (adenine-specific)
MDDQPHVEIRLGDCREIIATLPDCSVDSIVTDPPYELGFMGKKWDASGIAYDVTLWEQCLRVLKPGGHLLAFGGTRTYHRMTCAIEDSGFEIRDCIVWLYSSGFPKSHNVSLSIDKMNGHKNRGRAIPTASTFQASDTEQKHKLVSNPVGPYIAKSEHSLKWDGWGTALKPANEPIVVARKPLTGTVAANVTEYGTGAINIDGTRIGERWPANVIANENMNEEWGKYFFTPKASRTERNAGLTALEWKHTDFGGGGKPGAGFNEVTHGKAPAHAPNNHPTVKPLALMRYLVRLITPPGGTVLEPFAGSGTTLVAAVMEGCNVIGCEITDEYIEIIERRVRWAREQHNNQQTTLFGDTDG